MAATAAPRKRQLSHESLILDVLRRLPLPGGVNIAFQELHELSRQDYASDAIDWDIMPSACDPVYILDNPVNNTRRRGNLEQQMYAMVLGRPGESHAAAAEAPSSSTAAAGAAAAALAAGAATAATAATTAPERKGRSRGTVKRWQVESFAVVLRHLLAAESKKEGDGMQAGVDGGRDSSSNGCSTSGSSNSSGSGSSRRPMHVVDFGCGTGTLMLPLAVLFPYCHFTGVEMKPAAVALLLERARAAGLTNVSAVRGMIETFTEQPFDVALALHACGNATDAALLLAAARRAAYIVSPCCVGKLKFSLAGGSSFSASVHEYTPRMPGERPVSYVSSASASASASESAAAPAAAASPRAAGAATALASAANPGPATPASSALAPSPATAAASATAVITVPGAPAAGAVADAARSGHVVLGEVRHPRSRWLREHLPDPEANFRIMAKVADQNHSGTSAPEASAAVAPAATAAAPASAATAAESGGGTGGGGGGGGSGGTAVAAAHACKAHVELDRNLAASEDGYCTGLFKCFRAEAMAKSDLLVGMPAERAEWAGLAARLAGKPQGDV